MIRDSQDMYTDQLMAKKQNHIFTRVRTGSQAERLAAALSERNEPQEVRQISTVSSLVASGMGLRISCGKCGCEETLCGDDLEKACGGKTPLSNVKIRCSNCEFEAVSRIPVDARQG